MLCIYICRPDISKDILKDILKDIFTVLPHLKPRCRAPATPLRSTRLRARTISTMDTRYILTMMNIWYLNTFYSPSNSHKLHYGYSVYTDHDGVEEYMISEYSYSHDLHNGYSVTDGYYLKFHSHKLVKLFFFSRYQITPSWGFTGLKTDLIPRCFWPGQQCLFLSQCLSPSAAPGTLPCHLCDVGYPLMWSIWCRVPCHVTYVMSGIMSIMINLCSDDDI